MSAALGTGEAVTFWILAPLAILGSLGLIFAKNAVHAAIGMAATMVILGVFYIVQNADFVGVIQVFVYTGAVMMLFLFVLMLVGVDASDSLIETLKGQRWATAILSLGLAALLVVEVGRVVYRVSPNIAQANATTGNVSSMSAMIFSRYVWVFEITSALLITAAVGAMVLAHRERLGFGPNQREWSKRRFLAGEHVAGLPNPGVYARHNSVNTPALLPDGSPSDASVPRVVAARQQTLPTTLALSDELAAAQLGTRADTTEVEED